VEEVRGEKVRTLAKKRNIRSLHFSRRQGVIHAGTMRKGNLSYGPGSIDVAIPSPCKPRGKNSWPGLRDPCEKKTVQGLMEWAMSASDRSLQSDMLERITLDREQDRGGWCDRGLRGCPGRNLGGQEARGECFEEGRGVARLKVKLLIL